MSFTDKYFEEVADIAAAIDKNKIETIVRLLKTLNNDDGRIFVLGVGGSAANASHLVNDLRKLCGIEAYAPTDNIAEITARTNDEGFSTVFTEYLKTSRFSIWDAILILSVGGGDEELKISMNIVNAVDYAKAMGGTVIGIVGRKEGYTASLFPDSVLVIPELFRTRITPHSEAFQAVVWHCIVSHPDLQINSTKW